MSLHRILAIAALLVYSVGLAAQPNENLPTRAFQRIGTTKMRHGSRILTLAYSPDGSLLVAGGGQDPVRVWNPKTGEMIREINEHNVTCLAFTESGRTMLCAGYQKNVRLFDMQNNKETGRLEGHKAAIKAIAVSPDTTAVASGSQDGLVYIWEWNSKRKIAELIGHTDEVTAIAFSPDRDSNRLATASSDRTIIFWNIENNKQEHKFDAGCGVYALAFSADGKTLYSAGDDNLIRRWDVPSGKPTGVFKGHEGIVVSLFVQGDDLISGSLDRTVRFWNAKTPKQLRVLPRSPGDCDALAVTRDGDFLAMAGLNNSVRVFDAKNGKEVEFAAGVHTALGTLVLADKGKRLAALTSDGQVMVWDAAGKVVRSWDPKHTGETFLALAPNGATLATASNTLKLWNVQSGVKIAELPIRPLDPVVALTFSPDSKMLALGLRSSSVEVWDLAKSKSTRTLGYQGFLHALAWSPDGKVLAAGGAATISLWDPATGVAIRSFNVKEGPAPAFPMVASLAWGPDSRTLAAGCFDAVIRIYDTTVKTPTDPIWLKSCEGHLAVSYAIAFSSDGRTLLSGSFDKTARLWEAFSGKSIALLKGHAGPVMGSAFMPDGRSVYTASTDTTILQWDVPGLAGKGKLPQVMLNAQDLDNAWNVLATDEVPRGHETMWNCIANGNGTIAYVLKEQKMYLLDPEFIRKQFKDLNSGVFTVRQAAMAELSKPKYGRWLEGRYDAAMADPPSLEYKRRIEILKEKLNENKLMPLAQERVRLRRFMLICEQVGGKEAIEAMQQLAARGPEEEIREEAQGSLRRMRLQ